MGILKSYWVPLFFLGISVLALFPFLFLDRVFSNTDAATYYYPAFHYYSEALKSGQSFLWNPYIFSGFPTYLSQSAGFLDPLNVLLFSTLEVFDAYHIRLLLGFFLAMFFSYLAGRALGLSSLAALLIGPAYLTAFNWWYISNPVITNSLFLLPFLVWVGARAIGSGRWAWWWAAFGGLGIGWSFLAGYAQLTIYSTSIWGCFLLLEVFFVERQRSLWSFLKTAGLAATAAVIGGIVALPQILPALSFAPLTVRADGLTYALTTFKVINPGDLVLFLLPDYLYFPYLSGGRRPLYVGAILFLFSLAALVLFFSRIRERRKLPLERIERRMLLVLGVFTFCFSAAVAYSPVYYAMQNLPVFSYFRFPYRWMYVGVWFLAVLGAWGFDYVRKQPEKPVLKILSRVYIVCAALFGALVLSFQLGQAVWSRGADLLHMIFSTFLYGRFGFDKDPLHYRGAIERGIAAWQEVFHLADPSFSLPFLILLTSALLIYLAARGSLGAKVFSYSSAALSIATFLLVFIVQWQTVLPAAMVKAHGAVLETISESDKKLYRTFPFMLHESLSAHIPPQYFLSQEELSATSMLQFWAGWPNINIYASAASADGYDPFVPQRLLFPLQAMGSTHSGEDATRSLVRIEKETRLLANLDVLGVMSGKYVISGTPLDHKDLRIVSKKPVPPYSAELYLYENVLALPRIRFAEKIVSRPRQSLAELMEDGESFGGTVHLDCDLCKNHRPYVSDILSLRRAENGFFEIYTKTSGPRWLIVGESYLPGWVFSIDGIQVTGYLADGLYMAIEVPSGNHTIRLSYEGMRGELEWLRLFGLVKTE